MTLQAWTQWLESANVLGAILVVWRLYYQALYRYYPWFFIYLIYDVIETLWALIPMRDPATVYRYIAAQTIKTVLAAMVVFEIYHVALDERKALASYGRKVIAYILGGSFLISAIVARFSAGSGAIRFLRLRYTLLVEGMMDSTLFLFLFVMAMFLLWFPVEVRRNIVVYILGFEVYFVVRWLLLVLTIWRTAQWQVEVVNVISSAITLACSGFWVWGMRRSGELEKTTTGHRWKPQEMERLKAQLDEINESLERIAGK